MTAAPKAKPINAKMELPTFAVPVIRTRQPDGSVLLTAGKPVVVKSEIGTAEFARLTWLSRIYVVRLCEEGYLASRRATPKPHSKILIPRSEVERYHNFRL